MEQNGNPSKVTNALYDIVRLFFYISLNTPIKVPSAVASETIHNKIF